MTNEAKPTRGPVRVFPNDLTGHCEIVPEGAVGPVIARINPFSARSEAQGWADAHLIAEAFNAHHETGLTPRQLAEQRTELLEALGGCIQHMEWSTPQGRAAYETAKATIAKAKGGAA